MAGPNAGMKISKKNGITFENNFDATKYAIEELIDAANKDVGRFLRREVGNELFGAYKDTFQKGRKSMDRQKKLLKKYINRTTSYWARKQEHDLQIGYKHYNWMTQQELGESQYPRLGILREVTFKNIDNINKIQSMYIKRLSDDKPNTDNGLPEEGDGDLE